MEMSEQDHDNIHDLFQHDPYQKYSTDKLAEMLTIGEDLLRGRKGMMVATWYHVEQVCEEIKAELKRR